MIDASWQTFAVLSGPTVRYRYLAYSVDRGSRHALVRIGLRSDGAAPVSDLYVDPLTASVDELTAFDLLGKSPAHYAFLLLAVAAFAISVIAIVLIWRTRGLRRRWLWTIGSLLSVGHFGLYWSNGAWNIAPLYIQLLGASAVKRGMLTSWEIAFGVPVIAILFLIRRRAILRSLNLPQSNESGSTVA